MRNSLLSIGLVCLFVCNALAATCSLSASIAAREGASWESWGVQQQIFDISITNTGSCSFSTATVALSIPSGSYISESWNFDSATFLVSNFGNLLPGATYGGAGLVIAMGGTPTISSSVAHCESACSGTSAPTTAPTTAPTSAPTSVPTSVPTSAPTTAPTTAPTSAPGLCQMSVTQSKRGGDGSWTDGAYTYQIYDLFFTNSGSKPIVSAQFSQSFTGGSIASFWEIVKASETATSALYDVTLSAAGFAPGSIAHAGFLFQYATASGLVDPTFTSPLATVVCRDN